MVIFFALLIGYFVTFNAVEERKFLYGMKEQDIIVTGNVSKLVRNSYGWSVYLENVDFSDFWCRQLFVNTEEQPEVKIGNRVRVKGKFKHFEQARNPGNFDTQKYYMTLGVFAKVVADKIFVVDSDYDEIRQRLYAFRNDVKNKLQNICGGNYSGVWTLCNKKSGMFSAILLGDKEELDQNIKNLYSESGIAHILAISGLHISFIGMFLYSLLRRRFKFGISASVSIVIVVGFSIMSGMGIATIRATVMFGLRLMGEVLGRTYDNLTAISMAGILLMLWNPFVIFNSGFQMSFAAIISIVLVLPVIQNILQIPQLSMKRMIIDEKNITDKQKQLLKLKILKNKMVNALLLSITVGLAMNPIITYNYYQLPTYSFLLNIIVVPLMSVVIVSGIVGIGGSFISIGVGRLLTLPGCGVMELYTMLCSLVNKLPFSNVIVGKTSVITIIVYYVVFTLFLVVADKIRKKKMNEEKYREKNIKASGKVIESKRIKKIVTRKLNRKFVLAYMGMFCLLNILLYTPLSNLSLYFVNLKYMQTTFLDVGQGDGIFIRIDNGTTITVDGGSSSVDNVGQYRIIPFLKSQRVRKIDYAIMTHADNDHISGLVELIKESDHNGVKVKNLILPDIPLRDDVYDQMIRIAGEHKVKVLYITKGNELKLGDVCIKCIYPDASTIAEDRNDSSTVLSVEYKRFSMLLTGDISAKPESELQDMLINHYTILKVAHHGSKYSTSEEFLDWIHPTYSVISVGEHNIYGHPSDETLKRLKKNGSQILRTDESGCITVSTDGEKMEIDGGVN